MSRERESIHARSFMHIRYLPAVSLLFSSLRIELVFIEFMYSAFARRCAAYSGACPRTSTALSDVEIMYSAFAGRVAAYSGASPRTSAALSDVRCTLAESEEHGSGFELPSSCLLDAAGAGHDVES